MSDFEKTGGPAFPHCPTNEWRANGMSLRDWFAGMALQGMVSGSRGLDITSQQFAMQSYSLADAMLSERSKP